MQPGIYSNLDIEAYHGHTNSVSRSGLMEYASSPYKYWAKYINPERPKIEPTPAMVFGNAFHLFILEPHLFNEKYTVKPEPILLKDAGRQAYDDYKERCHEVENSGKIILTSESFNQLCNMRNRLASHNLAWDLIDGATYEQSYFWQDEHSGLLLKARPDILQNGMVIDLKTIADASPHYFQRSMIQGGYHIQGAIIRDAIRHLENKDVSKVINIAIEKTYPYSIGIYIIDEFALDEGHMRYKQLLLDLKNSIAENNWPSYDVQTISIPSWALTNRG